MYVVGWNLVGGGVVLVLLFRGMVAWFVGVLFVREGLGVGVGVDGMLLLM